ncbi:MAG: photosynthetic complex assembly protein PuhC [Pseudomonadota bacterium]
MNAEHAHDLSVPKPLLYGCAALIMVALAGVGLARLTGAGVASNADFDAAASITVTFADEADGGVGVYDYASGELISKFEPGSGGFVRVAIRSLAHSRQLAGAGPEAPFRLSKTVRGRLVLEDLVTGRMIGLEAFGTDNEGDFAKLFEAQETPA